ncbi:hypothetical protein OJ965_00370 (plasmid) [Pantoea anthophila]|uniref:hypothetical protein n=1 Tax=Pantoea anthophila TaxID=470931 RepID=UPI0022356446|nr:hypothetical protein [Pantoea anthophila]UZH01151.1 hypothetical protein OJ965_00370 [Pantoea anthophila]
MFRPLEENPTAGMKAFEVIAPVNYLVIGVTSHHLLTPRNTRCLTVPAVIFPEVQVQKIQPTPVFIKIYTGHFNFGVTALPHHLYSVE